MIVFDIPKFIKHEKGNTYFRSRGINKEYGVFCDYSKTEDIVEFEEPSGERYWLDIKPFFYNYAIREGKHIGVAIGNYVKTFLIHSIKERQVRGCSYLYALLIPIGADRTLNSSVDFPLNKEEHELAMPSGNDDILPF